MRPITPYLTGYLTGAALAGALLLAPAATPLQAAERIELRAPGATSAVQTRLRNASLLLLAREEGITDVQELFAAASAEYGRLLTELYGAGHYSGVVNVLIDGREASEISALELPGSITEIIVTVDPGPQFSFARADIAPLAAGTELPPGFAPGQPAPSGVIQDAARAAVDGWRSIGHAMADVPDSAIIADHRAATLDAGLRVVPGPVVTFSELHVTGNEGVSTERVREIAGFPAGTVFDPEALEIAAERLRRTGTFASVAISEAEVLGPGDTLDITATLIEAPPRRIGFGAEIDTEEGVRLTAFWLHRNLLGGAERLRVDGEVGGIGIRGRRQDYRFTAQFSRPATFTPDTTLTIGARAETLDTRDYRAAIAGADAGVTHFFSPQLTGELGIAVLYERVMNENGRTDRMVLALPGALEWDRRDDTNNPTEGFFMRGGATPFLGLRGTDSGVQLRLDARGYWGPGATDRVILAGRVQLGTVLGASIQGTPRDYLFYSGGGGTVRGQPFRSLGVEVGGEQSGGRTLAVVTGEVRTRVTDNIGVVGFADAGFVSAGAPGSPGDWHAGAGVGIRYQTAIGPIRADVAMPVAGDTGAGPRLYIGIGQAF